ncbi:MAG: S9 family peptidase [Theionarchaea archaeon]|nr:S9 family peptidase [Theionarchaea archaeon]
MKNCKVAPYGSWKSPITSDLIVSETIELGQIALDGNHIYWLEMRPAEGGRYVVVKQGPEGIPVDVTLPPFNVRTRVHEYGGGSYVVAAGTVYFSHFPDQRLYRQGPGEQPQPITPEAAFRYADGVIYGREKMICVREDHTGEGEAVNTLVSIDLEDGDTHVLVSGNDFYSSPRLSPDGHHLAWLTWNHPNMPWDGTELWMAKLGTDGSLFDTRLVAGGSNESIFQPEWSPDGILYFVSDRTGWWNLYCYRNGKIEPLHEMDAEFGAPQWLFKLSTYAFQSAERTILTYAQKGIWYLASLDTETGSFHPIDTPYTSIEYLRASPDCAVFRASSPTEPKSIVRMDLSTFKIDVLRRSSTVAIDPEYLSLPQAIEFPTENGLTAHAFYYAPKNDHFQPPEGEKPPLIVMSHGGPTDAAANRLNLRIQYWTSRGVSVLDVNYGGSTGYSRTYRERLNTNWGIVDVDDCVNGAQYLVNHDHADCDRLAIRGGSAGGYTTLCALTFSNLFRAGASYYGVSDTEALARETHKFESHYLDSLIGPYPERRDLYKERSPIHHIEHLSCPVIFFQGLEDKIVLPNQAEMMVEALQKKGIPVAYVPFEGEQHGFRRSENIKRALDAELYFYAQIFGFVLADPVEPVEIKNL